MYIRGGGKGGGGGAGGSAKASTVSRERAAQLAAAGAPGWTTRNDYNRALVPDASAERMRRFLESRGMTTPDAGTIDAAKVARGVRSDSLRALPKSERAAQYRQTKPRKEASAASFGPKLAGAFGKIDARNGGTNFVKLSDLRAAMPQLSRAAFDKAFRAERQAGKWAMSPHEGVRGKLTAGEKAAGIRENGELLVYVARRS